MAPRCCGLKTLVGSIWEAKQPGSSYSASSSETRFHSNAIDDYPLGMTGAPYAAVYPSLSTDRITYEKVKEETLTVDAATSLIRNKWAAIKTIMAENGEVNYKTEKHGAKTERMYAWPGAHIQVND
ncbi:hypothetical protein NDU88_001465 [Pleurodeles waltl]|uniref:Uncharacterized protein n=1 Tax=Pleurodeles waltl TaxID=8319 RepID=A0AAV7KYP3_PLEWA|nr:hypothetical protein NDU88_001465 [Pleurodeles waltl]